MGTFNNVSNRRMDRHTRGAVARFNDWAKTYGEDRISAWFRFYQSLAMKKLRIDQGCRFLDVGCGSGWAVREAISRLGAGHACGIDISPKMIEKAIAQTPKVSNVEFRVANAEEIPYPDESFSAILCTCSFHHYLNPVRALSEMKRVMQKDGALVMLDAARDVSFAIWLQDRWRRHFERSHVRYYTTTEVKALLAKAELALVGEIITIKKCIDHSKIFTGLMLLKCARGMG